MSKIFYANDSICLELIKNNLNDNNWVHNNDYKYTFDAYFLDSHVNSNYLPIEIYVKLYNHLNNIVYISQLYLLHDMIKSKYPKTYKKNLLHSQIIDITELQYDKELIKKHLSDFLVNDKKYILKPYLYTTIKKNVILKNSDDKIVDYIIKHKYDSSRWIIMKKIGIQRNITIKISFVVLITNSQVKCYIYHIEEYQKYKKQYTNVIKKIFKLNTNIIIKSKFCDIAYDIFNATFEITKSSDNIKLMHLDNEFTQYNDKVFVENLLNLVLLDKKNNFELIYTMPYELFNDNMIKSLCYYEYDRIDMSKQHIENLVNNLKNYKLTFVKGVYFDTVVKIKNKKLIDNKYKGEYTIALRHINENDWYSYNKITNIFIDRCNIKCKFGFAKSIYEQSQNFNFVKSIVQKMHLNNANINKFMVSKYIYNSSKKCSYFFVNIAYGFYKYFEAKSVLDISSGWGDRLIAACVADIKYYGADPNSCNTVHYNQMIELLGDKAKQKVVLSGFENLEITETYDLIFSSPPYFELEKYSNDVDQSHLKYNTEKSWIHDFLYVVIKKAWKYLNNGGHMCLYMNDYFNLIYCEDMVQYCISNLDGCVYDGVICIGSKLENLTINDIEKMESYVGQPLWMFTKIIK
jgi:hypothetical protein